MASDKFELLRKQVLRRVHFAANAAALEDNRIPPDGVFDTALTNGLLAIVAHEWPGLDVNARGFTKPASELLALVTSKGGIACIDTSTLSDGLDLTQPVRHGRSDDEFSVLRPKHVEALLALDAHAVLGLVELARTTKLDDLIYRAFAESAEEALPFDLDERLDTPEPDECDSCWRMTFLPSGWDMFGQPITAGYCIACGYLRTADEAEEMSIAEALSSAMSKGD